MQLAMRLRDVWAGAPEDDRDGAQGSATELAPIELFGANGREVGWIAPRGRRTSDCMNEERRLELYRPAPAAIDAAVDWPDPPPSPVPGGWVVRDPEDLLFVVPPSLPTNLRLRVHRRIVEVSLRIGEWRMLGRAHIRPGAEAGDYLLRGARRYVPLTKVELLHEEDPQLHFEVPVAIINISHVTHFELPDRRNDLRERPALTAVPIQAPAAVVAARRPAVAADPTGDYERVLEDVLVSRRRGRITRAEMRAQLTELLSLS